MKKRTYSIYAHEVLIERFIEETPIEQSTSKRIVKAIENCVKTHKAQGAPENISKNAQAPSQQEQENCFSDNTIKRLKKLFEYRKKEGKHKQTETLEEFVNELLDALRENIFVLTPKEL